MRLAAALTLIGAFGAPAGTWAVELPRPVYQIRIQASYDAETEQIAGKQWLTWTNTASVPVPDLWFHHYLNAFANNRSTFMRESGGRLRGDSFDRKRWGWIEVRQMKLADGTDLKAVEQYTSPDDGNLEDRTVARYPLPAPLAPGASISVEIEFQAQLPSIFARTGEHQGYVLAGQWFPKIAVFEDTGVRGRSEAGWNCHQFHAHSEFYADFGDYDVELTLPETYRGKIGATGEMVDETVADGKVTVRFVQKGVHDFAWTGDPRYLVIDEVFDPARDVPAAHLAEVAELLGLPTAELALPTTKIRLLLQPQHASQAARYIHAAKLGLRWFGLYLGPYPWATLTIVDPASGARGSGGMEYPTFFTGGTTALLGLPFFRQVPAPELVTIHEFGHNYFQGMIANNEFEESWIDEGINTYHETLITGAEIPPIKVGWLSIDTTNARLGGFAGGFFPDPIVRPSWGFFNSSSYGAASYTRPGVTLDHLRGHLGPATFHRAMRAFFEEWRFRHPSTADFKRSFAAAAGQDLDWFFDQALHSTRRLDYSVRRLTSRPVEKDKGVFWRDGGRVELGKDKKKDTSDDEEELFESQVFAFREGDFEHPVTVYFRFDDGHEQRESWDGKERWKRFRFVRAAKLAEARIDPETKLSLEVERLNDGLLLEKRRTPPAKLLQHLSFWFQCLVQATSLLA